MFYEEDKSHVHHGMNFQVIYRDHCRHSASNAHVSCKGNVGLAASNTRGYYMLTLLLPLKPPKVDASGRIGRDALAPFLLLSRYLLYTGNVGPCGQHIGGHDTKSYLGY